MKRRKKNLSKSSITLWQMKSELRRHPVCKDLDDLILTNSINTTIDKIYQKFFEPLKPYYTTLVYNMTPSNLPYIFIRKPAISNENGYYLDVPQPTYKLLELETLEFIYGNFLNKPLPPKLKSALKRQENKLNSSKSKPQQNSR